MTIYRPQIPWIVSGAFRVSSVAMGTGMDPFFLTFFLTFSFLFFFSYLLVLSHPFFLSFTRCCHAVAFWPDWNGNNIKGVYSGVLTYALGGGDVASYVNMISSLELPAAFFVATKLTLSTPFVFHFFNGLRHMVGFHFPCFSEVVLVAHLSPALVQTWDTGALVNNAAVIKTGWTVLALTAVSAGYLSFVV